MPEVQATGPQVPQRPGQSPTARRPEGQRPLQTGLAGGEGAGKVGAERVFGELVEESPLQSVNLLGSEGAGLSLLQSVIRRPGDALGFSSSGSEASGEGNLSANSAENARNFATAHETLHRRLPALSPPGTDMVAEGSSLRLGWRSRKTLGWVTGQSLRLNLWFWIKVWEISAG